MFSTIKSAFLTISLLLVSLCSLANADETIELFASRSQHTLTIKQDGVVLGSFRVAFGSGGRKGKVREGDHKTPRGTYKIMLVKDSDRFYRFLQLNYPNVDDAERALEQKLITKKQYQAIIKAQLQGRMPPQNTALGGAIGIHGIGYETEEKLEIHEFLDWTKGCIAMRNSEIDILSGYIKHGTKVTITD